MSRFSHTSSALVSIGAVEIVPVLHKLLIFVHDLKFYGAACLDKDLWVTPLVVL